MVARVCLITSGHLSTNPRLVKEADALVAAGYSVSIVATKFIPWADTADAEFSARPWSVEIIRFGMMANPVTRFYQGLRRRLARQIVSFFGFRLPWVERANHWIIPELKNAACKIPAEFYIAHNLAALPAAVAAAERHQACVMFDAEDFHSGELPEGAAWDFDRALITTIEKNYLRFCDAVTAASPGIARAYADTYQLPAPLLVLNVFPLDQAPTKATEKGMAQPGPSIYWFSQTVGPDRGLESAVQAIGLAKSRPHLYLRGNLSEAYRQTLESIAMQSGVSGHICFLPPGLPSDMVKLAAEFDLGLASEPGHSTNNRLACSNKIFTYLLAGLPSLASSTPGQVELAEMTLAAVRLYPMGDADALAIQMDDVLLDAAQLSAARKAAWNLGQQRFNWEVESKAWLTLVERLLLVRVSGKKR